MIFIGFYFVRMVQYFEDCRGGGGGGGGGGGRGG